uniref:Uncharacterized protein n=1 Tax=Wuchereria bancrofti TaxID=6293 RepID=A0AAF5PWI2_WUCBA
MSEKIRLKKRERGCFGAYCRIVITTAFTSTHDDGAMRIINGKKLIIIDGKFQESMLPDDDDMDDIKPPVNYKAMYEGGSESKYTDMELSVEVRYWIVLVLFISLLIIYRSLLPPLQCDTKFQ